MNEGTLVKPPFLPLAFYYFTPMWRYYQSWQYVELRLIFFVNTLYYDKLMKDIDVAPLCK